MKKHLSLLLIIITLGCKGEAELSMERGIQYYEWEKIEKAISLLGLSGNSWLTGNTIRIDGGEDITG